MRNAMYGAIALAAFVSVFLFSPSSAEASWYVRTDAQKESLYKWLQEQGYNVPSTTPSTTPAPAPAPAPKPTPEPKPEPAPAPKPNPWPSPRPNPSPAPSPDPTPSPQPNPAPSPNRGVSSAEQRMFQLVNQERLKAGLAPFTLDGQLSQLARMKSQDIVDKGYFSHTSPTYGTPDQMLRNAGIRARVMGAENLAKQRNVDWAHAMLMSSPGHRSNILYPEHDRIGIGVVSSGSGVVVTQLFTGN